jgi:carbon starvation protein
MDGFNFIPSRPFVLASFQFKAISLDPIIGPVIALQFGWLPALLWLLLGSILMGWVQDYLIVMLSMRNRGETIGKLVGTLISPRARIAFLILVYLYLVILLGQSGALLASLMERGIVASVLIILVPTSMIVGQILFRWRVRPVISISSSIMVLFISFWLSYLPGAEDFMSGINRSISDQVGFVFHRPFGYGDLTSVTLFWLIISLAICYLGALLPIWRLSIPLNALAAWTIALTMLGAICGWIIGGTAGTLNTSFEIPPLLTAYRPEIGPIWPLLFVLVASGSVSGWRILVASHTTSRQIEKESQALPITAGAVFAETILVVLVILFASVFGVSTGLFDPDQGFELSSGPGSALAHGIARTFQALGISPQFTDSFGVILLAMILITIMLLAFRFICNITCELLESRNSMFANTHFGAFMAAGFTLFIIFFGFWQWLWVLFIGINQLLSGLALLIVSIWLIRQGKASRWIMSIALFLFITSIAALGYTSFFISVYRNIIAAEALELGGLLGNLITAFFGTMILFMGTSIFIEGISISRKDNHALARL